MALVTGASAGIGRAFADVLAEKGYDLILTARREDRLHALARDLAARHSIAAHVIVADLAERDAVARIVDAIRALDLRVDVLVNNAGYGLPGSYRAATWAQHETFLRVLVVTLSELTHRLLPGMVERRWGRIINVASVAGLLPAVAGHTLYAAAKAYVVKFSESLAGEVRADGVHVTALCPGLTLSEFHDITGTRAQVSRLPSFMWLHAPTVAREGYDAVMRGDVVYINGRVYRGMVLASRLLPQWLTHALMARNAKTFRKM